MADQHQSTPQEPQPDALPVTASTAPPQPKKSNRRLWLIIGSVATVICLGSIACIGLFAISVGKTMVEKAPIESVLDAYMKAMDAKDIDAAYALFSPRAQRQVPISRFQDLTEGNNYKVFQGYQSLSVLNLNMLAAVNTNPDAPQGNVANVSGTISYQGGFTGQFNGTLEKVGDEWMIDGIFVNVPPDKFTP